MRFRIFVGGTPIDKPLAYDPTGDGVLDDLVLVRDPSEVKNFFRIEDGIFEGEILDRLYCYDTVFNHGKNDCVGRGFNASSSSARNHEDVLDALEQKGYWRRVTEPHFEYKIPGAWMYRVITKIDTDGRQDYNIYESDRKLDKR